MDAGWGFFGEAWSTAQKISGVVRAVIAVVGVVASAAAWWRFGIGFGLLTGVGIVAILFAITGMRLQAKIATLEDAPPAREDDRNELLRRIALLESQTEAVYKPDGTIDYFLEDGGGAF